MLAKNERLITRDALWVEHDSNMDAIECSWPTLRPYTLETTEKTRKKKTKPHEREANAGGQPRELDMKLKSNILTVAFSLNRTLLRCGTYLLNT